MLLPADSKIGSLQKSTRVWTQVLFCSSKGVLPLSVESYVSYINEHRIGR